jgi:hypothetical protein
MLWTTQIIALFPLFSQGLNRTFQVVFHRVKPLTKMSVVWAWFGRGLGVVWAWFGRGLGVVWAWFGRGLGVVWAWFGINSKIKSAK